jgi:hypothetical protein
MISVTLTTSSMKQAIKNRLGYKPSIRFLGRTFLLLIIQYFCGVESPGKTEWYFRPFPQKETQCLPSLSLFVLVMLFLQAISNNY